MGLTRKEDRPVAIRGLEERLIKTFGATGRYGVFEIFLHRCLLWKRSGSALEPIKWFRDGPVPSWSWMAYEGGIQYIDAPDEWVKGEIKWSISTSESKDTREGQVDHDGIQLQAPVWHFEAQSKGITLDNGSLAIPNLSKCVVIGESKWPADEKDRKCYVLIVGPVGGDGVEVWKRFGVGIIERRHIAMDGPKKVVRIQ